jgi:hypothetical protein
MFVFVSLLIFISFLQQVLDDSAIKNVVSQTVSEMMSPGGSTAASLSRRHKPATETVSPRFFNETGSPSTTVATIERGPGANFNTGTLGRSRRRPGDERWEEVRLDNMCSGACKHPDRSRSPSPDTLSAAEFQKLQYEKSLKEEMEEADRIFAAANNLPPPPPPPQSPVENKNPPLKTRSSKKPPLPPHPSSKPMRSQEEAMKDAFVKMGGETLESELNETLKYRRQKLHYSEDEEEL